MYPLTDICLGDCSYLETCRHKDMCKYVHYQVDPEDLKMHINKLQAMEPFQGENIESLPENKSGWKTYVPSELLSSKDNRIEMLKNGESAQWINCDLFNFDLKVLVEN
jgi:mRNA (2'-O-methyladenosine-N6-)-methyltransferase